MERTIGEIFEYNGEWYQCVIGYSCNDCAFNNDSCEEKERITLKNQLTKEQITGLCFSKLRSDKKPVIFKKLEKVGEPYEALGKLFQPYKLSENIPIPVWDVNYFMCPHWKEGIVDIEIKQNKEDMTEQHSTENYPTKEEKIAERIANKVSEDIQNQFEKNMNKLKLKPFSLEAAKAGKPVCTRDGRKVRVLCYDFKQNEEYPILVAIENKDGKECALLYSNGGISEMYKSSNNELAMLPEKKEGWLNIYKEGVDQYIYNNEKAALSRRGSDCIATIKIEWEE